MPQGEILLQTRRFTVIRQIQRTPDGVEHIRETVQHPGAVTILPLFDDGRVCLIRNDRIAVEQVLIELPAGTLEPGEQPEVTAARELEEETGYRAAQLTKLHEFFMSPGILNERMHVYVAQGLAKTQTHFDAGEQIENLIVTWDEAVRMALDGTIQDAKSIATLLLWELRRG